MDEEQRAFIQGILVGMAIIGLVWYMKAIVF